MMFLAFYAALDGQSTTNPLYFQDSIKMASPEGLML